MAYQDINIIEKKCSKCGEIKSLSEFPFRKDTNNYRGQCKLCIKIKAQKNYQENKDLFRERDKEWRKNNPEKSNAIYARYRKSDKRKIVANRWAKKNSKKQQARFVERYNNDNLFNLNIKTRRRIYMALKSQEVTKNYKTIDLLGCNFKEYKKHMESQFSKGMSWELFRKGKIHADHIIPCSSFDLSDKNQLKECFHYTNLQPLWAEDNLRKSAKLDWSTNE